MQQVVTLTGVETKGGSGDKGPWTLYTFKDAGGNKFQTFDGALGGLAQTLLGQPVTVTYEVETRQYTDRNNVPRTANNNVLQAVVAGAQAGVQQAPPAQQQGVQGNGAQANGGGQRDYSPLNRKDALHAAIAAHAAGIAVVGDPYQLFAVADLFVTYIDGGSAAVTSSGSSSQPAGEPVQY